MKYNKNYNFNDKTKTSEQKPVEPVSEKKGSVSTVKGDISEDGVRVTKIPFDHVLAKAFLGQLSKAEMESFQKHVGKNLDLSNSELSGNKTYLGIDEEGKNLILGTNHDYAKNGKLIIPFRKIRAAIQDYNDFEVEDDLRKEKFKRDSEEHKEAQKQAKRNTEIASNYISNSIDKVLRDQALMKSRKVIPLKRPLSGGEIIYDDNKKVIYSRKGRRPDFIEVVGFSDNKIDDGIEGFRHNGTALGKRVFLNDDGEYEVEPGILRVGNSIGLKAAGTGAVLGGLISAPIGALAALAVGDKKKSKLKRLLLGGLTGAVAGAGLGGISGYLTGSLAPWVNYDQSKTVNEQYLTKEGLKSLSKKITG